MNEALRLSGYREPLGLRVRESSRRASQPGLRIREIEFSSRGDRVSGQVVLPADGAGPLPAVILQADGDAAAALASEWAESGAAVATIDFPLRGARADQKLLDLVRGADTGLPDWRRTLASEFSRQAVVDLERTLDALTALEWIDADRIAFVGFGLGASLGAAFCALDARIRAAALGPVEAADELPGVDPAAWIARIAPRPVLRPQAGGGDAAAAEISRFLAGALRDG